MFSVVMLIANQCMIKDSFKVVLIDSSYDYIAPVFSSCTDSFVFRAIVLFDYTLHPFLLLTGQDILLYMTPRGPGKSCMVKYPGPMSHAQ